MPKWSVVCYIVCCFIKVRGGFQVQYGFYTLCALCTVYSKGHRLSGLLLSEPICAWGVISTNSMRLNSHVLLLVPQIELLCKKGAEKHLI